MHVLYIAATSNCTSKYLHRVCVLYMATYCRLLLPNRKSHQLPTHTLFHLSLCSLSPTEGTRSGAGQKWGYGLKHRIVAILLASLPPGARGAPPYPPPPKKNKLYPPPSLIYCFSYSPTNVSRCAVPVRLVPSAFPPPRQTACSTPWTATRLAEYPSTTSWSGCRCAAVGAMRKGCDCSSESTT